jgi:hypothetical protein
MQILIIKEKLKKKKKEKEMVRIIKSYLNQEGHFCLPHSHFISPHCAIYLFLKKGTREIVPLGE